MYFITKQLQAWSFSIVSQLFIVETQRRMQFWFNLTSINQTEDVIDGYFHIYKKKASLTKSTHKHTVTVRLT